MYVINDLERSLARIEEAIEPESGISMRDCGYFLTGYNAELDDLRSVASTAKDRLLQIQPEVRVATTISRLKVSFNKVFGYYIEGIESLTDGINLLRPIPCTGVFNRLAEEGRLLYSSDNHYAYTFSWGQEMLYKPLRIPLQEFIPSYTALTSRVFTVQNAVKRAMRASRLRSEVLMFTHRYGMAHKDLMWQLREMR
jgi:MutS family domain IV